MSFIYIPRIRTPQTSRVVSYSVQKPGKRGGKMRHNALFGADILAIMGWKAGDKVAIGFGAPASPHAGWMEVRRDPQGGTLRATNSEREKPSGSAQIQIHFYPDFMTDEQHAAEHCFTWNREGDALRVKLPEWALKATHRGAESPADRPPVGSAETSAPANSSLAEAGGGDSSGRHPLGPDAPPAVIRSQREGRAGTSPPSTDAGQPGSASSALLPPVSDQTAASISSGDEEDDGTTLRSGQADKTGGSREKADPPGRIARSAERCDRLYAVLVECAEKDEPAPTNRAIAGLLGLKTDVNGLYVLQSLERDGRIVVQRFATSRVITIIATGKSTRQAAGETKPHFRAAQAGRFSPAAEPAAAPFKAGPLPAVASSARPSTLPPIPKAPAKLTADSQGGVAPLPPVSPSRPGTVTMKFVVDWVNEMGMSCAALDGGMYLLGEKYVEAQDVIDRATDSGACGKSPISPSRNGPAPGCGA